jgi:hypothetical protein
VSELSVDQIETRRLVIQGDGGSHIILELDPEGEPLVTVVNGNDEAAFLGFQEIAAVADLPGLKEHVDAVTEGILDGGRGGRHRSGPLRREGVVLNRPSMIPRGVSERLHQFLVDAARVWLHREGFAVQLLDQDTVQLAA